MRNQWYSLPGQMDGRSVSVGRAGKSGGSISEVHNGHASDINGFYGREADELKFEVEGLASGGDSGTIGSTKCRPKRSTDCDFKHARFSLSTAPVLRGRGHCQDRTPRAFIDLDVPWRSQ
ncbi:hypothetical protein AB1N83_012287 [Pleurotus pulmonarius]